MQQWREVSVFAKEKLIMPITPQLLLVCFSITPFTLAFTDNTAENPILSLKDPWGSSITPVSV